MACNPRKNAALHQGNRSDKIDARELANRLRLNDLKPVYHGQNGVRMLRELARSYQTISKDLNRVISLYPLGQPEKALGHEPQIDLCVAPTGNRPACQLQELIRVVAT